MADAFGVRVTTEGARARLTEIERQVDVATLAGVKKASALGRNSVRSGMRGRPRWDHRGPIGDIPSVSLNLTPAHISRGGGPGSLTGHLRRAVGTVKRPKRLAPGTYAGGVGVGGPLSETNLYRKHVEAKYPYMKPGVKKAEPKMRAAMEVAWRKAIN